MTGRPHEGDVDRDAARRDALALLTALAADMSGVPTQVVVDWLDADLRPDVRTVVFAEQLTFWSALLFTLTCRDRGLDPATTALMIDAPQDAGTFWEQAALLAVSARLARRADQEAFVYAHLLGRAAPRQAVVAFLLRMGRVGVALAAEAAAARGRDTCEVLADVGVASALADLGG